MSIASMPLLDPAIAAQNQRKIEKDRRKKRYHDSQVQETNNHSIVSKRSVELLYRPVVDSETKEWFRHFVPKDKRRSPAINRGYWLRMESIKQAVLRIVALSAETTRVVNLGCGFDPFPFHMLGDTVATCQFFDFDYPELVQRKLGMVRLLPEIMAAIGPELPISEQDRQLGVVMRTRSYVLVGCDLKNSMLYEKQLALLLGAAQAAGPVVFIAEVSLAYMTPKHADAVLEVLSRLPNAHVLVLEQIMPAGARHFFARKMLYHFQNLTSPLQCVETYSTQATQRARFRRFFPSVAVVDLLDSWRQLVLPARRRLVALVEDFDEWEEFLVFCHHYVVVHATNSLSTIFSELMSPAAPPVSCDASIRCIGELDAKFPAAAGGAFGTYMFGGMSQTRSDVLLVAQAGLVLHVKTSQTPGARMCHTFTSLGNGNIILLGGRTRPGHDLDDAWLFHEPSSTWSFLGTLPAACSRHGTVAVDQNLALFFADGTFYKVQILLEGCPACLVAPLHVTGDAVPRMRSFGMVYTPDINEGYIVGGMICNVTPEFSRVLYKFSLHNNAVHVVAVHDSPAFERMGCMLHHHGSKLAIFGGAGPVPQSQDSTIIEYDMQTRVVNGLRISDLVWDTAPVFIGSQLVDSTIIGGGAVCYSFGSHYNKMYEVDFR